MKTLKNIGLAVLIALIFTTTVYGAGTGSSTSGQGENIKQLMLEVDAYGNYNIFAYCKSSIESPYEQKGYQWRRIKTGQEIEPSNDIGSFLLSYSATEYIVNYFLDDEYFILEDDGISPDFEPYHIIDKKTNTEIENPAIKLIKSKIPFSELHSKFGISVQNIGNVYILSKKP